MNDNQASETKSPCIRRCCLDDNNVCLGCFRTLDEITGWHSATPDQKEQILIECENRRKGSKPPVY